MVLLEMKLFAVLALVSTVFLGATPRLEGKSRSAFNTTDREAVIRSWEAEFDRTEPAIEWTGDVEACNGGTTSIAYQLSILQRANWLRRMAGVPDVTYRADLNAQQQAGALISRANQALTHYPDSTLKCFTQAGYDSNSKSNLSLGVYGAAAMDGYVYDSGDNNKAVGHRWWLLHPGLKSITSGDVPSGNGARGANALHVFDVNWQSTTTRDGFVAWPPPGYVPGYTVYPRWSLASFSADENFSDANVSVTGPNGPLAVTYDYRGLGKIVFAPTGFERAPLKFLVDQTYVVTITGVTGGSNSTYSYSVTIVPINRRPRIVGLLPGGKPCSLKGETVAFIDWIDQDVDTPVSVSLVRGDGAIDNARFAAKYQRFSETWDLTAKNNLDGNVTDFTVRLRITDARGASSEGPHTFALKKSRTTCKPAASTTTTRITRRTVNGSITRRTSRQLRSYTSIPAGTLYYGIGGDCTLTADNRKVVAGKTKGSCVIVIDGRTSKTKTIVTVYLQVR